MDAVNTILSVINAALLPSSGRRGLHALELCGFLLSFDSMPAA